MTLFLALLSLPPKSRHSPEAVSETATGAVSVSASGVRGGLVDGRGVGRYEDCETALEVIGMDRALEFVAKEAIGGEWRCASSLVTCLSLSAISQRQSMRSLQR